MDETLDPQSPEGAARALVWLAHSTAAEAVHAEATILRTVAALLEECGAAASALAEVEGAAVGLRRIRDVVAERAGQRSQ